MSSLNKLTSEWQKKHKIADNDPLLAAVELFQIYINSLPTPSPPRQTEPPSFNEFRDTLEKLDQLSKRFINVGQDVINELRKKSSGQSTGSGMQFFNIMIIGLVGIVAGYLAARFQLISI
jgi:hypothetical protein